MKEDVEILAPVGNYEMFEAALAAKADVVFLASKSFGARAYADNFSNKELGRLIDRAHWNDMGVYITFNTLIKEKEIDEALSQIEILYELGIDAIIMQDLGLITKVHQRFPDLPIHGSTQLSVTSLEGASLLEKMGLSRIVLGREVSIEEVKRIKENTSLEIELFVHGSLCVSVSGQCLLSSFSGGRSGNRGRCAQPCRKSYILKDKTGKVLGEENTYMSPRDLMTIDHMEELLQTGVDSLKIEGRMKKPEYVYSAVQAYRKALKNEDYDRLTLELMTNRPFTEGFLFHAFGPNYNFSEDDETGRKIGTIQRNKKGLYIRLEDQVYRGDIIRVRSDKHAFPLTLTQDYGRNEIWDLSAYPDLLVGEDAYLIYREKARLELDQAIKEGIDRKRPLSLDLYLHVGEVAKVRAKSEDICISFTDDPVDQAKNQPLTRETIEKSMSKLGQTQFYLQDLSISLGENCFMPLGKLNDLRRQAVHLLEAEINKKHQRKSLHLGQNDNSSYDFLQPGSKTVGLHFRLDTFENWDYFSSSLHSFDQVIVHSKDQLASWSGRGKKVYLSLPQHLEKEGYDQLEASIWEIQNDFDGFYLHNLNDLGFVQRLVSKGMDKDLDASYSFNFYNSLTAKAMDQAHLNKLTISAELSFVDIRDLLEQNLDKDFSLLVYGRLNGMKMKYCPASPVKGCVDNSQCPTCKFNSDIFLEDQFGFREVIRQNGYSFILLPDLIDLRLGVWGLKDLDLNTLDFIDRGEGEINQVLLDWDRWRKDPEKAEFSLSNSYKYGKRTLGNYETGVL